MCLSCRASPVDCSDGLLGYLSSESSILDWRPGKRTQYRDIISAFCKNPVLHTKEKHKTKQRKRDLKLKTHPVSVPEFCRSQTHKVKQLLKIHSNISNITGVALKNFGCSKKTKHKQKKHPSFNAH